MDCTLYSMLPIINNIVIYFKICKEILKVYHSKKCVTMYEDGC